MTATEEMITLAAISIRNLDDRVQERLRSKAARHGRSMEAEIRAILVEAVREQVNADGLFETMLNRFDEIGGVELELFIQSLTSETLANQSEQQLGQRLR